MTKTVSIKYSVSLPSTSHIDVDYHLHNKFYVKIALANGANKPYNGQYYSVFSVIPRYEGCKYGFFLPLNYNNLTKSKQTDVFIGFRFGQLYAAKK
ncbi:hypothetical protein [Chitinophaga sp. YR573]|uniref:hypothetical protein n=1 Tax=Chitinophaga sp. YR573 TaxID=1881040 RepID=UPI000B7F0D7F|nr:hypothetical protein [Chitinophaga sp. YR573]